MREIKFRAWDTDKKIMIEPNDYDFMVVMQIVLDRLDTNGDSGIGYGNDLWEESDGIVSTEYIKDRAMNECVADYLIGGKLVEEAKVLREQYLEIEEKIRELGETTKRVQTFVSKLKDNK